MPFIVLDDLVSGDTVALTLFVDEEVVPGWSSRCVFVGVQEVVATSSIPSVGRIEVRLSPSQTQLLGGPGKWDAQVTSPDGDVFTVVRGRFEYAQGVS